jgi:hypothetical protein
VSAPVRFLAVAVAGWALFRGVSAGMLPAAKALTIARAEAASAPVPPIVPTQFPAIAPVEPAPVQPMPAYAYAGYAPYAPYGAYAPPQQPRYIPVPVYYPAGASARSVSVPLPPADPVAVPEEQAQLYAPPPKLDGLELAQAGPQSTPDWNGHPASLQRSLLAKIIPAKHLDRMQFSAWALLRGTPGTGSLASGGTLGGSQGGARLTYAFDRRIAISLRSSSPVGGSRGGEVAAGIRLTPFPAIPLSITAERRQAIGSFSTGRSDFALFAEGGLYQRPLGWNLFLDGYAQAGVVGARSRDLFADGGLTVGRPLFGRFSAGLGVWGGYQPGLYRVDAGPRVSMRVRSNVSVHLDWRQRLAGVAAPASGPALTLGADF